MFKVKGQWSSSRGQSSRSQRNVTYKQEKRSKMATDRLSEFKLGTGDVLKQIGTAWRWASSSCNAFAIDMFSSFLIVCLSCSDCIFHLHVLLFILLLYSIAATVFNPAACMFVTCFLINTQCSILD